MRVVASALLVLSLGSLAIIAADRADAAGFSCGSGKPNPTTGRCDCVAPQVEKTQGGISKCTTPEWHAPPAAQCPPGQKKDASSGKCVIITAAPLKPSTTPSCPDHSHWVEGKGCVGDVACIPGTHYSAGDGCVVDGLLPQACAQVKGKVDYGGLKIGSHVVLGKHRPVNGDEYWADEMDKYVGLTAEVRALSDVDGEGCGLVQVDADNETYFWRIRDLKVPPTTYPQACGVKSGSAVDYGVQVGWKVVLSKHRAVDGDEYWNDDMMKYVGKTTEVKKLAGVDPKGCPIVHVEADKENYFWRVRDLKPATKPAVEAPPAVASGVAGDFEQSCGQKSSSVRYGLAKGDSVVLAKHRAVDGDDYWAKEMATFVGQTTTVAELAGVDPKGCAVVRVEADKKTYYWRVRDLKRGYGAVAPPAYTDTTNPGDYEQACGKKGVAADYAPLKVGDTVILGRHRMYEGDDDWASDMDAYVGKLATITKLDGVYGAGCPYVRVDIDKGAWAWRLRDLRKPGKGAIGAGAELPMGQTWSSGVWMIDRSSDGYSAHLWTAGGTTAIELLNGSDGRWRIRKGTSEKVVFSDRTTNAQSFAERPWKATPYGTAILTSKTWSMSSGGYTTRIEVRGGAFTVTLADGKTITGDASGAIWFDGKAM